VLETGQKLKNEELKNSIVILSRKKIMVMIFERNNVKIELYLFICLKKN
jgi:hypothetical protein